LLTFPIRIDPIGPAGLCLSFGLASISPGILNWFGKRKNYFWGLISKPSYTLIDPEQEKISIAYRYSSLPAFFLIIGILVNTFLNNPRQLKYPMVLYPFGQNEIKIKKTAHDFSYSNYVVNVFFPHDIFKKAELPHLNLGGWFAPFNFKDFIGRLYYKIDFVSDKPLELERSFQTFTDEGVTNFYGPSGGIMKPRNLQNRIAVLEDLYFTMQSSNNDMSKIKSKDQKFLKGFFLFWYKKLSVEQQRSVSVLRLKIKFITVPYKYEGNSKPWLNDPWINFFEYNVKDRSIKLFENIPMFKVDFDRFDETKGLNIILKP